MRAPELRRIHHPYSDDLEDGLGPVRCYSIAELLAEKLRALAERCRPRDLYDVVNVHRHADLVGESAEVLAILDQKCAHARIAVPDMASIESSEQRIDLEQEWESMLAHQLLHLPPFDEFWGSLGEVFDWLAGRVSIARLPRAELDRELDPQWVAPRMMTSWRGYAPLELIRFAGANRLKVEIDYRAAEGRRGPRIVEPYSLRMTLSGDLLLYVLNDRGDLRSYRVDRIAGVQVTNEPFAPRFWVEF